MDTKLNDYEQAVAGAIIAVDTIWGGNVSSPSGMERAIADSYFSGKDLPECFFGPEADVLRKTAGASAKKPNKQAIEAYLNKWQPEKFIERVEAYAQDFAPLRKESVLGLTAALRIQVDLAREQIGTGPSVPYERCVVAAMGQPATEIDATPDRERVRELLGKVGEHIPGGAMGLTEAVDAYRKRTWVGHEGLDRASQRVIGELEELVQKNFVPHLPEPMRQVPRANVKFCLIEDAWFSGSMNYIGRGRTPEGEPLYEAEYEINAKIEKSQAEFTHLVSHEVVPGHVTTFALIQNLFHRGLAGFETTILTMNTRFSTLFEGVANAALLMAYGVRTVEQLPGAELQLGVLLSQLEDAAKNNASYYTYVEHMPADEIKRRLRQDCLATVERANKLTDAWAQHPLMGRAYMPSYRHGTDLVLGWLGQYGPAKMIPLLYGVEGVCDCVTLQTLVRQKL